MIHRADGVTFRRHHFHAFGLDRLLELLRDRQREQIVAGENGDAFDVLVLLCTTLAIGTETEAFPVSVAKMYL